MLTELSEKGDLSLPVEQAGLLHSFTLDSRSRTYAGSMASWEIDRCLDLNVGDAGIIGRRISVYEDSRLQSPVAEGIIGWN